MDIICGAETLVPVLLQNGGLQVCEGTMSAFRPHTDIKGIADAALAAAAADGPSRDGSCEEIFPISKIWASHCEPADMPCHTVIRENC